MKYSHPGLKFIYNGPDNEGISIEIDDSKSKCFYNGYYEYDDSSEGNFGHKYVNNTDPGEIRSIKVTYQDFIEKYGYGGYSNKEELIYCFITYFKETITEALLNIYKSFNSNPYGFYTEFEDYENIKGYQECIRSVKEDNGLYINYLIGCLNHDSIRDIREKLIVYYKFNKFTKISKKPIGQLYYENNHGELDEEMPFIDEEDQHKIAEILHENCSKAINYFREINNIDNSFGDLYFWDTDDGLNQIDEIIEKFYKIVDSKN